MPQEFYVILYHLIYSASITAITLSIVKCRKRRGILAFVLLMLIENIVPVIATFMGYFKTGYEMLPLAQYPVIFLCIPVFYYCVKGNAFGNFCLLWLYSQALYVVTSVFFASTLMTIDPTTKPLKACSGMGDLHFAITFLVESLLSCVFSVIAHRIMYAYFQRLWKVSVIIAVITVFFTILAILFTPETDSHYVVANYINCLVYFMEFVCFIIFLLILYVKTFERDERTLQGLYSESIDKCSYMYDQLYDYQRTVRMWRHDIKNHLMTLNNINESYITQAGAILSTSTSSDAQICENAVLNSLLFVKKNQALEAGIDISYDIYSSNCNLENKDLICVAANLLDNAIEACLQVPEGNRRISLETGRKLNYLYIEISNSKSPYVKVLENNHRSTKTENPEAHGYGSKIVSDIVDKYNGNISYEETDTEFGVSIMLEAFE